MAENIIDTLSLEIESNSEQAIGSIDKLANSLLNLKKGMSGFNKKGFGNLPQELRNLNSALMGVDTRKILNFSTAIKGLSESIRALSGIGTQIIPAAKNLEKISKLDFSKIKIGDFSGFGNLSSGMNNFAVAATNLGKVSPKEINRTISAFERLGNINLSGMANSFQSLNGIDVTALKDLGMAFQGFISSLSGSEKVHTNIAKIINSLSQLTASAGSIPTAVAALPGLTNEIKNFVGAMSTAPSVQPGTVSIVSALAQIGNAGTKAEKVSAALPGVTVSVKQFIEELSKAPAVDSGIVKTVQSLAQLSSAGAKTGSAAQSLQKKIAGLSSSMKSLQGGTKVAVRGLGSFAKQLLSMAGLGAGIFGFVSAVKKSITAASDLAESTNVISQGFGDMAWKIEDFSATSIQSFGLSELSAKNYAGIFSVMGKSLGLAQNEATDMAVSLTGLTADLSSFYNVSQDVANTALKSVFTSETESLKKFGIVMTEANLKAYALSQGITKSYSAMSQAEKTQLRYNFVMDAASSAMGDFARTAGGSWANQVRILQEQFRQLAGIVGGVLMAAFLPIIRFINIVISKIVSLATVLSNFLGKLFGFQKATSGTGAGLANIADSAGALADNMEASANGISDTGGAAKKAGKEMNKYIAAWHEVNSMSSNDSGDGGGGGAGGGGAFMPDMSLPTEYDFKVKAEDEVSPVLDKIKNRFIQLKNLFLKGFRLGLGDTSVFDSITKSLGSIRDNLLEIFTDGKVVSSFNEMIDTLTYNAGIKVGSLVSIGASIIDNILGGVSIYLDEAKERIGQWLINMFDITAQTDTIKANFINALGNIFTVFRSDSAKEFTAGIAQAFVDAFMNISELSAKFGRDILGLILNPITENAQLIKDALLNTITPLAEVVSTVADSFSTLWEKVQSVYDEHIGPTLDSFASGISEIVETLLNGYNQHIAPVLDRLSQKFNEVWEGSIHPLIENFIGYFGDMADLIKTVWENVLQPVINWIAQNIMPVVGPVLEAFVSRFLDSFGKVADGFNSFITVARGVIKFLEGSFSGDWKKCWEGIKMIFSGIWNSLPDAIKIPIRSIIGFVNKMIESIESGLNYVVRAVNGIRLDVPDWVPGIGGETFGFNINEISLGRIPQLAKGGVVNTATFALLGEDGQEAVLPLQKNTEWMHTLSSRIADNLSKFSNLELNYDVPKTDDYIPKRNNYDMSRMESTLQMALDERAAQEAFEMRQLQEGLTRNTQVLEKILSQGIILDDGEFTRRYKHAATEYRRRSGRELGLY